MLPSTSSHLRQGPTHVTDTGRCPMPCPNPTEVARLGQLSLCCSRSGAPPSSRACSVLIPALRLSRAAVCAATELSACCSQDLSDLRTVSVLRPDRRGEPVVTSTYRSSACFVLRFMTDSHPFNSLNNASMLLSLASRTMMSSFSALTSDRAGHSICKRTRAFHCKASRVASAKVS